MLAFMTDLMFSAIVYMFATIAVTTLIVVRRRSSLAVLSLFLALPLAQLMVRRCLLLTSVARL